MEPAVFMAATAAMKTAGSTLVVGNALYGKLVNLLGSNGYNGTTTLKAGSLRLLPNAANLGNNTFRFNCSNGSTAYASVLETSGLFARDVGTGSGQVAFLGYSAGGFAAYGAPLTVTLSSDAELDWTATKLNGITLMLNSERATHAITLTNPLKLDAERNFNVYENPATDQDVAFLSGKISGPNSAHHLNKGRSGTLVLANNNNDFNGRLRINGGAVRVTPNSASLPAASILWLSGYYDPFFAILESSGTFARNIGTAAGQVNWESSGGFAAFGGPLSVTLNNNANIIWNDANGFNKQQLQFGSPTANDVVTLTNPIKVDNSRTIKVFDNPYSNNDRAVLSGALSGSGNTGHELNKSGDGLLELAHANNVISGKLTISQGTLRVTGGLTCYWVDISTSGGLAGRLEGSGTLTSQYGTDGIYVRNQAIVAPGDGAAGTLTFTGSRFYMLNGSTYEFEFGPNDQRDLLAVTANVRLDNTWNLKLKDIGNMTPFKPENKINLITYTGNFFNNGTLISTGSGKLTSANLDTSSLDPEIWDVSSAEVRYDADAKLIYLTGIKGGTLPLGTVIIIR